MSGTLIHHWIFSFEIHADMYIEHLSKDENYNIFNSS